MMKYVATTLAALVAWSPASASEQGDWMSDGWKVVSRDTHCIAATSSAFEGGMTSFGLNYNASKKLLTLFFSSSITSSLKEGEYVHADFTLLKREALDQGWGTLRFEVGKARNGDTMFILPIEEESIQTMLNDLAANDRVGLFKNDILFAGAELTGSAAAMKQLRSCAFGVVGLDPRDPFAQ